MTASASLASSNRALASNRYISVDCSLPVTLFFISGRSLATNWEANSVLQRRRFRGCFPGKLFDAIAVTLGRSVDCLAEFLLPSCLEEASVYSLDTDRREPFTKLSGETLERGPNLRCTRVVKSVGLFFYPGRKVQQLRTGRPSAFFS